MRTPRDELLSDLIHLLSNAYGDGGLTAEQELRENTHNAEDIVSIVWKHLEPLTIENNGNLMFSYGLVKHTLGE